MFVLLPCRSEVFPYDLVVESYATKLIFFTWHVFLQSIYK